MPIHPGPSPTTTSAILDDLRRVVRVLRESSRAAERDLGVSGAQLFVLKALSAAPAALSLGALAVRTRTHQSTVSVVVKRLVGRRLVARAASPVDARRLELSLTPSGRRLLERAPLAAQDRLIAGLESLVRRDRDALAAALRRLVDAMGISDEPAAMFFEDSPRAPRSTRRGRPA